MMFGVPVPVGRCGGPCPQPDVKPYASRRYRIFSFATALLDGIYARVVGNLADRIAVRIRARGPITFADYMETALFDPEDGYYTTRASLGFEGDYVTSVDLGPAFGRSLARAVADLWTLAGKASSWDLVEAGAGRGILMRDLLGALERERSDAARGARPAIVEVSPRLRAQQSLALEGRDLRWASVAHSLAPIQGVVFANEVLDAFPVHVLARTADGVREVYVGEEPKDDEEDPRKTKGRY